MNQEAERAGQSMAGAFSGFLGGRWGWGEMNEAGKVH